MKTQKYLFHVAAIASLALVVATTPTKGLEVVSSLDTVEVVSPASTYSQDGACATLRFSGEPLSLEEFAQLESKSNASSGDLALEAGGDGTDPTLALLALVGAVVLVAVLVAAVAGTGEEE
jgi:hypothetical protein